MLSDGMFLSFYLHESVNLFSPRTNKTIQKPYFYIRKNLLRKLYEVGKELVTKKIQQPVRELQSAENF